MKCLSPICTYQGAGRLMAKPILLQGEANGLSPIALQGVGFGPFQKGEGGRGAAADENLSLMNNTTTARLLWGKL